TPVRSRTTVSRPRYSSAMRAHRQAWRMPAWRRAALISSSGWVLITGLQTMLRSCRGSGLVTPLAADHRAILAAAAPQGQGGGAHARNLAGKKPRQMVSHSSPCFDDRAGAAGSDGNGIRISLVPSRA